MQARLFGEKKVMDETYARLVMGDSTSFERRCEVSSHIRKQYPDRVPILFVPHQRGGVVLDRRKYLAVGTDTVAHMLAQLRRSHLASRAALAPDCAMFCIVLDRHQAWIAPRLTATLAEVDATASQADGFLYATCTSENTFGGTQSFSLAGRRGSFR